MDTIKNSLLRLQQMVEGWERNGISEVERDMALEELRHLYSTLRFDFSEPKPTDVSEPKQSETTESVLPMMSGVAPLAESGAASDDEPEEDSGAASDDEPEEELPEIEVEIVLSDEEALTEPLCDDESDSADAVMPPVPADAAEGEDSVMTPVPADAAEGEDSVMPPVPADAVEGEDAVMPQATNARRPEQSLFGDDDIVVARSPRRSVIMSLYDDEVSAPRTTAKDVFADDAPMPVQPVEADMPTDETDEDEEIVTPDDEPTEVVIDLPTPSFDDMTYTEQQPAKESYAKPQSVEQPSVKPQPVKQQPAEQQAETVLGDVLRSAEMPTLGESISRPKDLSASTPVRSLRAAIGLNDRFLLIRDLFAGDEQAYEHAIVAIDAIDNLDDCMVYILENYSWRSGSDGARLIMDLIQRKFS